MPSRTQPATGARSSTARTVIASAPMPRASAAMSASGKRTVSSAMALRTEVVDLGAVGGVVVDEHEQPQAEPHRGLQLREAP